MLKRYGFALLATLMTSTSATVTAEEQQLQPWQDPAVFQINRLPTRAFFHPMQQADDLSLQQPWSADNFLLLNGQWRFNWVERPEARTVRFADTDYDDSAWDEFPVPANWEINGYGIPYYHSHNCFAPNIIPPELPTNYNPVGQYRKQVTIPQAWLDQRVVIHLGAVKSAFFLYVNGQRVGYSEDSKIEAEFDVTEYLNPGTNTFGIEVYRYSDGSYFECQDMWRLSGIERDVYLFATPKTHIQDIEVITELSNNYADGQLNARVQIANRHNTAQSELSLTAELSYRGEVVATQTNAIDRLAPSNHTPVDFTFSVDDVAKWSAETPLLYDLKLTLNSRDQGIEFVNQRIGFRSSEYRDGQFLVNGQPVLFKGVNRHEHDPITGHVVSRESMELDARLMKENNINAVRLAHYPNDPYWYQLADEVGFYLIDEANIESHGLGAANQGAGYNPDHHIVTNPHWQAAYIDRIEAMFERSKNNPSVVIRSLGNETGDGINTEASYDWLKARRDEPVISEQAQLRRHTDAYGQMYASLDQITHYAESEIDDRPVILIEYEHAMGNSLGNFAEYWETFEHYDSLQGGFIWDWVDQTFLRHTTDNQPFWAYGGDLEPPSVIHSDSFCANGLVFADRSPYPYLHEVRRVQQDIGFELNDTRLEVHNKFYFRSLQGLSIRYQIIENGQRVFESEPMALTALPQSSETFEIDWYAHRADQGEVFVNVKVQLDHSEGLLDAGYVIAEDQFKTASADVEIATTNDRLRVSESDELITLRGAGFRLGFDKNSGLINSYQVQGEEVLKAGVRPEFWRAPIDNDFDISAYHGSLNTWQGVGRSVELVDLMVERVDRSKFKIETVHRLPSIQSEYRSSYTIHGDGRVEVDAWFYAAPHQKYPELPRIGTLFQLATSFDNVVWYGRGPHENYWDRRASADVGIYEMSVDELYTPYVRPQENGYRTDIRHVRFTNDDGIGVEFVGAPLLNFGAQFYSTDQYDNSKSQVSRRNLHPHDLTREDRIYVNIDFKQRGVGGTDSWGSPPLFKYTLPWLDYHYQFTLRPIDGH